MLKELEQWRDMKHSTIAKSFYERLIKLPFIDDTELQGFNSYGGHWGWFCNPMMEDHPTARKLWGILRSDSRKNRGWRHDSHHLMHAIEHGCAVFLTMDRRTVLNKCAEIQAMFPNLRLLSPSELLSELEAQMVCRFPNAPRQSGGQQSLESFRTAELAHN